MPTRQRVDVWTSTIPKTQMQRNAFLDTCVNWLTMEPADPCENETLTPTFTQTVETEVWENKAFTLSEHNIQSQRVCTICTSNTQTQALTANPFAQRYIIYVCSKCGASVS